MAAEKRSIPVWYFIGWLLLIYGILIFGAGFALSAQVPAAAADLDAGVWWGALLMAIGVTYVGCFRPGRRP